MICPKRNKPVKAVKPDITIRRVKEILNVIGCNAEIYDSSISASTFYSYHLILYKENNPIFRCNGKGMTPELALGSAYGELMERLQNLHFYMATIYHSEIENVNCSLYDESDFKYSPDEQIFTVEKLVCNSLQLLQNLFLMNNINKSDMISYLKNQLKWDRMICVPFLNIKTKEKHFLPFRFIQWIVGSNGMCAGNTSEEALIHGISEIFERAVLKRIYLNPFTPPDIPLELFSGNLIFEKIKQLEQSENLRIVIKDCSLGKELPVIGILVFSDDNLTYTFHLGADPNPITALERCFTELFQGGHPPFHAVPSSNYKAEKTVSSFWQQQLHHSILSYSGQLPSKFLAKTPDYAFRGFPYEISDSDRQDLDWLIQLIKKLGQQILVRNTGFLGFPSYYLYIPGMSEITNAIDNRFVEQLAAFEQQLPLFFKIRNVLPEKRLEIVKLIKNFEKASYSGEFDSSVYFKHCQNTPIAQMKSHEIISVLQNGRVPDNQPNCFECSECKISDCSFLSMSSLWQTLKKFSYRN